MEKPGKRIAVIMQRRAALLPARAEEAGDAAIVSFPEGPRAPLMSADHQDFLRRWSRLKRQASVTPESSEKGKVCVAPPELPAIESLKFESDFGAFMQAKVDQGIRRAALKKLFSDPRFNVMDGLDVYIDDYSKEDPIPPGMLAQLEHARTTLFGLQTENKTEDEKKPPENNQISEGAPTQPAASNVLPETHYDADLVSKPGH